MIRADLIKNLLNKYVPDPKPPLECGGAYMTLIAVLLSARTTDVVVNRIIAKLFAKVSTPEEMAELTVDQIYSFVKEAGLAKRKAIAISKLSKILVEKYKGRVPASFKELESLPGVGHKTASVVMSQAFSLPAFPVDTHVFRCARRWGLSNSNNILVVERDLKKSFNKEEWGRIHLQIILYARKYCPSRNHLEARCPICLAVKNKS